MTPSLIAASLLAATGFAHSYLGERYILMRLFRRDNLPKVFGNTEFTTGTLRFVWHLLTVAWCGLAYLMILGTQGAVTPADVRQVIGVTALVSGLFPLIFTKGKHLSWIVFFAAGALLLIEN